MHKETSWRYDDDQPNYDFLKVLFISRPDSFTLAKFCHETMPKFGFAVGGAGEEKPCLKEANKKSVWSGNDARLLSLFKPQPYRFANRTSSPFFFFPPAVLTSSCRRRGESDMTSRKSTTTSSSSSFVCEKNRKKKEALGARPSVKESREDVKKRRGKEQCYQMLFQVERLAFF